MSVLGKNFKAFKEAIYAHDKRCPSKAYGIGLAYYDLTRLDLDEGEEIFPGITVHSDGKTSSNFRVLCDGQHNSNSQEESEEIIDAVSKENLVFI